MASAPPARNEPDPASPDAPARYRAFLSYSWGDKAWGERLHRWLERYRVPEGAAPGLPPSRRLGKIFRDDEDMAAAGDIGAIVRRALEASENLIVVCSPRAAQSRWVDAEIAHFKAHHPQRQVFAVIVDGEPNSPDPARECFPRSLRVRHGPDGEMPIEPVGVDVRRDDRARVCARLAAGMLGVDFDDLWRRDQRRAERRARARTLTLSILTATFAALTAIAVNNAHMAHLALSRFFAERAWQRLQGGDPLAAARYALAGRQLAPQNEALYLAALGAIAHETGANLPPILHDDAIVDALVSPDGETLVTTSRDGTAKAWRLRTTEPIITLGSASDVITAAAFTRDGRQLILGDARGGLTTWSTASWRKTARIDGDGVAIVALTVTPAGDAVLVRDDAQGVAMRALEVNATPIVLAVRNGPHIWNAALSPDGRHAAIASEAPDVRLVETATGAEVARLRGHESAVLQVAFAPKGDRVATASGDGTAMIWDVRSGRRIATLIGHGLEVFDVAFSSDGRSLVTASVDRTARIWDARTGAAQATLSGHENFVTRADFSADDARVLTASDDGAARVWNAQTGRVESVLRGHAGALHGAFFAPDGARAITTGADGAVRIWSVPQTRLAAELRASGGGFSSVEFSPDGSQLLAATSAGALQRWRTDTLEQAVPIQAANGPLFGASFASDGATILIAGEAGAGILDAKTGAARVPKSIGGAAIYSAAYFPDQSAFATAEADGLAQIRNARTGAVMRTLRGHKGLVRSIAIAHDGTRIITGGQDGAVKIWSAATGAEIGALTGHAAGVGGVAISRDDNLILTTSDDGEARLWDAKTFRVRRILKGHDGPVYSGAFSSDGARVVTASEDKTARIWDVRDGRLLVTLADHDQAVFGVAFSPRGDRLATASEDGAVRLFDVSRLTQSWPVLSRDVCVTLLGPRARRFTAEEIAADPLLANEWPDESRDVCASVKGAPRAIQRH